MTRIELHGRPAYGGMAEGEAIVSRQAITFGGGIDPETGRITDPQHELSGSTVAGRVLVFPYSKGSSSFSKAAYALWLAGNAPAAWVIGRINPQTASGSVVMRIPTVTELDRDPTEVISTGDWVKVDGEAGIVEVTKRGP